jgi:hypothetical protein
MNLLLYRAGQLRMVTNMVLRTYTKSEPGADRGPHAGSPRGVVVATASFREGSTSQSPQLLVHEENVSVETPIDPARPLRLPVLTLRCASNQDLRNKWIIRRVAIDPKKHDHTKQQPDIFGVKLVPL